MPGAHARWARQTSVATLLLPGRVGTPGASQGSCSLCRPRPMGPGTGIESDGICTQGSGDIWDRVLEGS